MRKYIIGGIVGLVIGLSGTAGADTVQSLVGKAIQGQTAVYVDGKEVDTAIIVDGKSYAPARSVGESAGYSVSFVGGEIHLDSQVSTEFSSVLESLQNQQRILKEKIVAKNNAINFLENTRLPELKAALDQPMKENVKESRQARYDSEVAYLQKLKDELAALEQQAASLDGQIAELEGR